MKEQEIAELVKYRLKRAKDTLHDINILVESEL